MTHPGLVVEAPIEPAAPAALPLNDALLSVRMVSGMMHGVAESLGSVSSDLQGQQKTIETVRAASAELAQRMAGLLEVAKKVDGLVALIQDIALQTRLLSINASVEAVRAGEFGRGFEVVAGQVKDLSRQTNGALGQIQEALAQISKAAAEASARSDQVDQSLGGVCKSTRAVADQLAEQAEVSKTAAQFVDDAVKKAEQQS